MSSVRRSHFEDVGESQRECSSADLASRGALRKRKRINCEGLRSSMGGNTNQAAKHVLVPWTRRKEARSKDLPSRKKTCMVKR